MSISQNFPEVYPSLTLDFANSKTLDPRITFTRSSTGTYVGADGLIKTAGADEARFDHNPTTGESLGLLVEESRTNLLLRSEEADSPQWNILNSSITVDPNVTVSPDGSQTADKVKEATTTGGHAIEFTGFAFQSGTIYTVSFYAKAAERSRFRVTWPIIFTNRLAFVDISPGGYGVISDGGTVTSVSPAGNDWFRVVSTSTCTTTTTGARAGITLVNTGTNVNYTGDGTSGIYIWGAQLEQGSFPTSYIPTTNSTVTRTADNVSMVGENFSSWYNPSEGTVYTQFRCDNWNVSNHFGKVFTINEGIFGVENNGFWIGNDATTSNSVRYRVRASGINQFGPANLIRTSNIVKSALSVKTSDFAVTIDGNTPTASTSGTLSTSMTNMTIGRDIVGIDNQFLNGTISKLFYYPERLTNTQLQNLTK
jgi:hypothetical protein